jgi:hypothetical protein
LIKNARSNWEIGESAQLKRVERKEVKSEKLKIDCHGGLRAASQCRKQKAEGLPLTFDDLLSHFMFKT